MKVYLVGGAVRDKIFGVEPGDRDWVVVGESVDKMLASGYQKTEAEFPVFLHPDTGEEYALARTETNTGVGYHGFSVDVSASITLEQDLARRDLTINAMAQDEQGQLTDPYDGQSDLQAGYLRHVTSAFVEDPLRVLRVARFAARFGQWGFRVAHSTHVLMKEMVDAGALQALPSERVWKETRRALGETHAHRYFEVLHACGALTVLMPEVAAGMDERTPHAEHDAGFSWLQRVASHTADIAARFASIAALCRSEEDIIAFIDRLKVSSSERELAGLVFHNKGGFSGLLNSDASGLVKFFESVDAFRREDRAALLFVVCEYFGAEPAAVNAPLLRLLSAARAVDSAQIKAQGYCGRELGFAIREARLAAVSKLGERS